MEVLDKGSYYQFACGMQPSWLIAKRKAERYEKRFGVPCDFIWTGTDDECEPYREGYVITTRVNLGLKHVAACACESCVGEGRIV